MTDPAQSPAAFHFDDLEVGATFRTDTVTVTADEIKAFAQRYDPQPFHLDEAAARSSVFGELVASGWLTASLTMRLLVGTKPGPAGGWIGLGVDHLKWPQPVRPGDRLTANCEVTAKRLSRTSPDKGVIQLRLTTCNQAGEAVLLMTTNVLVRRQVPLPSDP